MFYFYKPNLRQGWSDLFRSDGCQRKVYLKDEKKGEGERGWDDRRVKSGRNRDSFSSQPEVVVNRRTLTEDSEYPVISFVSIHEINICRTRTEWVYYFGKTY